ncbi:hypothetical protein FHT70_002640 [Rhizobium sp. BK049]|nr:hypothetical protein [Rhizobium sp. BK049]
MDIGRDDSPLEMAGGEGSTLRDLPGRASFSRCQPSSVYRLGCCSTVFDGDVRSILPAAAISAFLGSSAIEIEAMSEPQADEKIDATFRNGSLTATGIILGFSLNFISLWVSNPNDWSRVDLLPMSFLTVGIAIQVKVFADLLARDSLLAAKYDRARRLFLIGLSIVAVGMGIALLNDILGLSSMRMFG